MKHPALVLALILFCAGPSFAGEDALRGAIIASARTYLGTPYVYGASSPKGFDCSGFVSFVYHSVAGISLPRSSGGIWSAGAGVKLADAKPGDVVVFNTVGQTASHVAILLDKDSLIHAVSEGPRTGVIISPITDRYFGPRIMGVRSFISQGTAPPRAPQGPGKPASPEPLSPGIEVLGLTITRERSIYSDKIPAVLGSAIRFALTNDTGEDGTFEVLFYKMHWNPALVTTLRRERAEIKAGETLLEEALVFTEPGQYKLIVKTASNLKLIERVWRVVALE